MAESLYVSLEGRNGKADVYEITVDVDKDKYQSGAGSSRPWDIKYEVRYGAQVQEFWAEGEAVTVAKTLAGVPD
jgi:hypothetical protein